MTETANQVDQLLSLISSRWPGESPLAEVEGAAWPPSGRTYADWKQYINDDIRTLWPRLSLESRLALYLTARRMASFER